jgi:flavorubredoxin
VITEVFKSKTVLVGSPTINRGISVAAAGILEEIEGLRFKNKTAAAFGSYGWSGESVQKIASRLESAGFKILLEGLKVKWNPDAEQLSKCEKFGRELVGKLK